VLLLAALSQGTTTIHDLLDSDDTRVMLAGLKQLGCSISPMPSHPARRLTSPASAPVAGRHCGHAVPGQCRHRHAPADCGAGGAGRRLRDDGRSPHVRAPDRRPGRCAAPAGCKIDYLKEGFPPLQIGQPDFSQLGSESIKVRGDVSSQFLTALLMALPLLARTGITIEVVGELISKPYRHHAGAAGASASPWRARAGSAS
jgi:3-phosphoshikimate 1-carboxyvinyltransferase